MKKIYSNYTGYYFNGFPSPIKLAEIIKIQKSHDLVDAAIIYHLSGKFIRQMVTPALLNFKLSSNEVGIFGKITLRKLSENTSEISFYEPDKLNPIVYGSLPLRSLVADYCLRGEKLSESALSQLEHSWTIQGKPFNDFNTWLSNVMKYGGYLEFPEGFKPYTAEELFSRRQQIYLKIKDHLVTNLKKDNLIEGIITKSKEGKVKSSRKIKGGEENLICRSGGRKKLKEENPEEYIFRLAHAQKGIEMYEMAKKNGEIITWSSVCKKLNWLYKANKSGVKVFYYARLEYKALQREDPENWLPRVSEYWEKEKIKT